MTLFVKLPWPGIAFQCTFFYLKDNSRNGTTLRGYRSIKVINEGTISSKEYFMLMQVKGDFGHNTIQWIHWEESVQDGISRNLKIKALLTELKAGGLFPNFYGF